MRYCKKLDCAGTIVEREGTGTRMREERRGRPKKKKRPDFIKRASERASKKKKLGSYGTSLFQKEAKRWWRWGRLFRYKRMGQNVRTTCSKRKEERANEAGHLLVGQIIMTNGE